MSFFLSLLVSLILSKVIFTLKEGFFLMFLILMCLSCFLFMGLFSHTWFSVIFFLVYVGGLLVLFFYVGSLSPKNLLNQEKVASYKFLIVMGCFLFCIGYFKTKEIVKLDYSYSLFSDTIFLISLMVMMLFYVLWVLSKILKSLKSPLRPFMFFYILF